MGENTTIPWTTHSWNPWLGCDRVHTGCLNCYAQRYFKRQGITGKRRRTSDANWKKPLKWNRQVEGEQRVLGLLARPPLPLFTRQAMPSLDRLCRAGYLETSKDVTGYRLTGKEWQRPRVFAGSLMDAFEDWQGPIVDAKGRTLRQCVNCGPVGPATYEPCHISHCPKCDQIGGVKGNTTMADLRRDMYHVIGQCQNLDFLLLTKRPENIRRMWPKMDNQGHLWYRKNVWLIYSASDQESLEAGINHLLECKDLVPVLGLSLEPLIGPIDLGFTRSPVDDDYIGWHADGPIDVVITRRGCDIRWVIVGAESGPGARPMELDWLRDIVDQCKAAGVACFVKQDNDLKPGQQGRILDELWAVKQFPEENQHA